MTLTKVWPAVVAVPPELQSWLVTLTGKLLPGCRNDQTVSEPISGSIGPVPPHLDKGAGCGVVWGLVLLGSDHLLYSEDVTGLRLGPGDVYRVNPQTLHGTSAPFDAPLFYATMTYYDDLAWGKDPVEMGERLLAQCLLQMDRAPGGASPATKKYRVIVTRDTTESTEVVVSAASEAAAEEAARVLVSANPHNFDWEQDDTPNASKNPYTNGAEEIEG